MTAPSLRVPLAGFETRGSSDTLAPDAFEESLRGRYRLEHPLDTVRHVWAAVDTGTGAAVAIKLGRPRNASEGEDAIVARLRREADALRRLDGAGVPLVLALNERPPWLALERVDGVDLERRLAMPEPLAEAEIAALCTGLAETLSGVHAHGLLHADIKPSNIVLCQDAPPILLDFGSARRLGEDGAADGSTTPEYAAPEFHSGQAAIGPWSDLYALGAVAYRMITGRAPVASGARLRGVALPATAEAAQSAVSDELAALVDWALELDPAARPLSAEEWRQAVRRLAEARSAEAATVRVRRRVQGEAREPARVAKAAPATRRSSWRWKVVAAAIVLAIASSSPFAWREGRTLYETHFKQEWLVDAAGHGDTASLADALARARAGATIRVMPGSYRDNLTIARPVELLGIVGNGALPVIATVDEPCAVVTAPARIAQITMPCVDVAAGQTSIEKGRLAGASVRNGAELRLVDTAVSGGVVATGGAGLTISGGEIRGAARSGVIARGGAELRISGTQIVGNGEAGILLAEGATARIESAAIAESGTSAIEITSGARATVLDSALARASQAGIFVVDGGRVEVGHTTVTNSGLSGLVVAAAGEAQVTTSSFEQNREHGVLILDNARGSVSGTRLAGNGGSGIALERGATAELSDNIVEHNREPQILDTRKPDTPDRRRGGGS